MIQQALVMLLLLVSAQAIAATPCPTCPKGYAISSMEEAFISRQKEKELNPKKNSGKIKKNQEKLPATNIMNQTLKGKPISPLPYSVR